MHEDSLVRFSGLQGLRSWGCAYALDSCKTSWGNRSGISGSDYAYRVVWGGWKRRMIRKEGSEMMLKGKASMSLVVDFIAKLTLTFFICFLLSILEAKASSGSFTMFNLGEFSPDGNKFSISYCSENRCDFGVYEIKKEMFSSFKKNIPNVVDFGGFSPDGCKLAISVLDGNSIDSQIAVYDIQSGRVEVLTSGSGRKTSPSFSGDGKKIVFSQADYKRGSGKTSFSSWDIYEIILTARSVQKLTNHQFFQVSSPYYFGESGKVIFSGDLYTSRDPLRKKWLDNTIYVFDGVSNSDVRPYLIHGDYSSQPAVSRKGDVIAYVARTDREDGVKTKFVYDVFLVRNRSVPVRVTRFGGLVTDISISGNGEYVFASVQQHNNLRFRKLYLIDVADQTYREVIIDN